ncbi:MAG: hypothetical protein V7704_19380 [Aurantimonas endophytica]|uniref:hypothetical protein n=1 Tax=Aurantimonas endophytica TaxID=1522175 RepID=UPI003001F737
MKFEVIRQHLGDRMYMPGDEREISEADAAALVKNGVLKASRKKAEPAPQNKMEQAPANKAERSTKAKGR